MRNPSTQFPVAMLRALPPKSPQLQDKKATPGRASHARAGGGPLILDRVLAYPVENFRMGTS